MIGQPVSEAQFRAVNAVGGPSPALAVCDAQTKTLLGDVSWVWRQRTDARIAQSHDRYLARIRGSGAGTGTQAQQAVVDLFFRHTAVNRVEAGTDVDNVAEQRALKKAGFTREGTTRGAQWRDGAYHDCHLYSILRSEWEAR